MIFLWTMSLKPGRQCCVLLPWFIHSCMWDRDNTCKATCHLYCLHSPGGLLGTWGEQFLCSSVTVHAVEMQCWNHHVHTMRWEQILRSLSRRRFGHSRFWPRALGRCHRWPNQMEMFSLTEREEKLCHQQTANRWTVEEPIALVLTFWT